MRQKGEIKKELRYNLDERFSDIIPPSFDPTKLPPPPPLIQSQDNRTNEEYKESADKTIEDDIITEDIIECKEVESEVLDTQSSYLLELDEQIDDKDVRTNENLVKDCYNTFQYWKIDVEGFEMSKTAEKTDEKIDSYDKSASSDTSNLDIFNAVASNGDVGTHNLDSCEISTPFISSPYQMADNQSVVGGYRYGLESHYNCFNSGTIFSPDQDTIFDYDSGFSNNEDSMFDSSTSFIEDEIYCSTSDESDIIISPDPEQRKKDDAFFAALIESGDDEAESCEVNMKIQEERLAREIQARNRNMQRSFQKRKRLRKAPFKTRFNSAVDLPTISETSKETEEKATQTEYRGEDYAECLVAAGCPEDQARELALTYCKLKNIIL